MASKKKTKKKSNFAKRKAMTNKILKMITRSHLAHQSFGKVVPPIMWHSGLPESIALGGKVYNAFEARKARKAKK